MGISIAQLNMLSAHFGFDIAEARQLLGLPVTTKSAGKCGGSSKNKPEVGPKKRARSGYNLYCADAKARVESTLKSEKGVTKLARGELVSEMSKRWKQLPESTREMGNERAITG